jgi:hypothetical protein
VTAGRRDEALDNRFEEETTTPSVIETNNVVSSDLQALIAAGVDAPSVHGNGAAVLSQTHAFKIFNVL